MTDMTSDLQALFKQMGIESEQEKVASHEPEVNDVQDQDTITKLAEDLTAGGEIMGKAFADSAIEALFEKIAGSGVPAAGGGSENPIARPRSNWESVAARLAAMHGRKSSVGDDTSVRAEDSMNMGAGHDSAIVQAKGSFNPAKPLG